MRVGKVERPHRGKFSVLGSSLRAQKQLEVIAPVSVKTSDRFEASLSQKQTGSWLNFSCRLLNKLSLIYTEGALLVLLDRVKMWLH